MCITHRQTHQERTREGTAHLLGIVACNGHVWVVIQVAPGCPLALVPTRTASPVVCIPGQHIKLSKSEGELGSGAQLQISLNIKTDFQGTHPQATRAVHVAERRVGAFLAVVLGGSNSVLQQHTLANTVASALARPHQCYQQTHVHTFSCSAPPARHEYTGTHEHTGYGQVG